MTHDGGACGNQAFSTGATPPHARSRKPSALRPTMIGHFRQAQLGENRIEAFVQTPALCLRNRGEESGFLLSAVSAMRRDYQRPFLRRRFSLEISAMTSRRRWISLSNASSLGRSFLRPRG